GVRACADGARVCRRSDQDDCRKPDAGAVARQLELSFTPARGLAAPLGPRAARAGNSGAGAVAQAGSRTARIGAAARSGRAGIGNRRASAAATLRVTNRLVRTWKRVNSDK